MTNWVSNSAYSLLESIGYRPRELYTFTRGNEVWRMNGGTSLIEMFVRPSLSYTPALITRDRIERSDESRASTVTVRVARTAPVADALREVRSRPMRLTIERWQDQDGDHPTPVRAARGDVANVRLIGGFVEFDLVRPDAMFDLPFPTRLISRQNQFPIFSAFTGVNEDDFSFETTIAAIVRSKITVDAKAPDTDDGYYDGGLIRVGGIGDHGEAMYVRTSTGLDFFINGRALSGLSVGDAVTLVAGDDRRLTTARDKFGPQAVLRFLGFDQLPTSDVLQTGLDNAPIARSPYADAPTSAPGDPTPSLPSTLVINQAIVELLTEVQLTLTVDDPDGLLTSIEARANSIGFAPDWSSWSTLTPTDGVYRFTAGKGYLGAVRVQFRITHTAGTETTDATYAGGWTDEQTWAEDTPSAGQVSLDLSGSAGLAQVRAYLTATQDDEIVAAAPSTFDVGDSVKLALDARSGPHTLTFPPSSTLNGSPATSMTVNGLVYLQMTVGFAPSFDWVTLA